jgi:hypothetical protein
LNEPVVVDDEDNTGVPGHDHDIAAEEGLFEALRVLVDCAAKVPPPRLRDRTAPNGRAAGR